MYVRISLRVSFEVEKEVPGRSVTTGVPTEVARESTWKGEPMGKLSSTCEVVKGI